MNICLHSTLKYGLESNHEFLLTPVSGATSADYQNEARALQWIQASFATLVKALDQFKNRPDLILTAAVFSGIEPASGLSVLRIMAFNLDIFCYFQEDLSLQIAIFDDKNLGHMRFIVIPFRGLSRQWQEASPCQTPEGVSIVSC